MRVAMVQANVVVGDLAGNAKLLLGAYDTAVSDGADLVVTTELALCGYPPEDLLLKSAFIDAMRAELRSMAGQVGVGAAGRRVCGGSWRTTPHRLAACRQ